MSTNQNKFDVFCPNCNILVEAKVIAEGAGGFRSSAINPIDEIDSEYHGHHYTICLCARCSQPFLIRESLYGVPGEFETITETEILYPVEGKLPIAEFPVTIKPAYDQAVRSFSASLFEPCVLMCGKCLEATCKILGVQGRNLKDSLKKLFESG